MAGDDVLGALDQRPQALERRAGRRSASPAGAEHRDLDRREVVAGDEHARPGRPDGHPVGGVPVGRDAARARGRRSRSGPGRAAPAPRPSASGRGRSSQSSSSKARSSRCAAPGSARQPLGACSPRSRARAPGRRAGRAGDPSRRAWRAGRWAAGSAPARASDGQQLELVGEDGRVDHEGLLRPRPRRRASITAQRALGPGPRRPPAAHDHAVGCSSALVIDEHVGVQGASPHRLR